MLHARYGQRGKGKGRAVRGRRRQVPTRPRVEPLEGRCLPSVTINEFPIPRANSGPTGITAGPDGNLWFTNSTQGQVGEINPSTHAISQFALPMNGFPLGITAGPDGNLWFTEALANKFGEINPSTHAVSEFAVPTPLPSSGGPVPNLGPCGITAGPDGNLWFTEATQGQIGEVVLRQTPTVTWSSPADITYGTALGAAQLDASASVPGTFAYAPAAGTVLGAGANQPLSVTFTPTDTVHYKTVKAGTTVNVLKATPAFSNLTSSPVTVGAASTSLPGALSAPTAIPASQAVTVTAGGASTSATVQADGTFSASLPTAALTVGSYTINYAYAGDANFNAASANGTLDVTNGAQVLSDLSKAKKAGSTLHVELQLTDAGGNNLSSASATVTAVGIAPTSNPNAIQQAQAPGNSDPSNAFSFTGSSFTYTLKTPKGLPAGSYLLYFTVQGDPVTHSLTFKVKQ
jgi:hypothetical protein